MKKRDCTFGRKGEDFFLEISAITLFYGGSSIRNALTGKRTSVYDLRSSRKEGDFILSDGSLVEVKSDGMCYKTGNLIVELSGRNGDVGWFQHCKKNGVKYLVWHLYRGKEKKYPYLCIRFDFGQFAEYVEKLMRSKAYMSTNCQTKVDSDGAPFTILKVNLDDAISHCQPLLSYMQRNDEEMICVLQQSLISAFEDKGIRFYGKVDPSSCILQYMPK